MGTDRCMLAEPTGGVVTLDHIATLAFLSNPARTRATATSLHTNAVHYCHYTGSMEFFSSFTTVSFVTLLSSTTVTLIKLVTPVTLMAVEGQSTVQNAG